MTGFNHKHITYSVGVLYLVIFNLPREERFKRENIILLGIIPGPSEPKRTMNSYLGPFVRDMLEFWEGEKMWHEILKCLLPFEWLKFLLCVIYLLQEKYVALMGTVLFMVAQYA